MKKRRKSTRLHLIDIPFLCDQMIEKKICVGFLQGVEAERLRCAEVARAWMVRNGYILRADDVKKEILENMEAKGNGLN